MINGVCQKSVGEQERIWDYCGVVFPEGYISADRIFLFNNEQIERVYMIGYQDEEQLMFKEKAEGLLNNLREGK